MSDEPAFPKPRPKSSGYREPAVLPTVRVEARRSAPVVVARPEPPKTGEEPSPFRAGEKLGARDLLVPIDAERTYWQRERFVVRHPRLSGVILLVGSTVALVPTVTMRLERIRYDGGSFALLGAVSFTTAIWLLVAGAPFRGDGRPPAWWVAGLIGCSVVGLLLDLTLLS